MTFFGGRIGISPSAGAFLLLEISAFGVSTFDGIVKDGRALARMRGRTGNYLLRRARLTAESPGILAVLLAAGCERVIEMLRAT